MAVASGTAALHAAYAAIGLSPGQTLVTTPLTFSATATTALHLGARVRFADVCEDTLNLDPSAAAAAIDASVSAITAVDYAGHPADIPAIQAIAEQCGAVVVEDAAHAIGGSLEGVPVGAMASLTTFSFHPVKTVTSGEGGAVVCGDARFEPALRRFRDHGMVRAVEHQRHPEEGSWHQEVHALGLNYRMPDILAALGTSQLRRLGAFVARRRALVARYHDLLAGIPGLRLPAQRPGADPAWHLFAVRVLDGRRREVHERLRAQNIGTQVHYWPVHRQPLFEDLGYRAGICPVAESAYDQLLSLPLFPAMTDADQDRVAGAVREILQ